MTEHSLEDVLTSPASLERYQDLLMALKAVGPFKVEVKKTSIHLVRRSAFLGVHPRKAALLLTVKGERRLDDARVVRAEQVSKSRWHNEVRISSKSEIDAQLISWMREAYELSA